MKGSRILLFIEPVRYKCMFWEQRNLWHLKDSMKFDIILHFSLFTKVLLLAWNHLLWMITETRCLEFVSEKSTFWPFSKHSKWKMQQWFFFSQFVNIDCIDEWWNFYCRVSGQLSHHLILLLLEDIYVQLLL